MSDVLKKAAGLSMQGLDRRRGGPRRSGPLMVSTRWVNIAVILLVVGGLAAGLAIRDRSNTYEPRPPPEPPDLDKIGVIDIAGSYLEVSAGTDHTCALRANNTITCWGNDKLGETGAPLGLFTAPPGRYSAVAAGGHHTCATGADGTITCWGNNLSGQTDAPSGRYSAVAAGSNHACGLRFGGVVACWGDDLLGRIDVPAGRFRAIAASGGSTCGLRPGGAAECWGTVGDHAASAVAPSGRFEAVFSDWAWSCGLRADATLLCSDARQTPPGRFGDFDAGNGHACGVHLDGSVSCWGDDTYGQATPPPGWFTAISAGRDHTCGLRADGGITCWGLLDRDARQSR